ncbi:hypothetical protein BGX38DRAFT_1274041 [Terfezia claveryi]|nr:hypothetical protein BGX38DRAFT_1274041 [Terfezia claveryi]
MFRTVTAGGRAFMRPGMLSLLGPVPATAAAAAAGARRTLFGNSAAAAQAKKKKKKKKQWGPGPKSFKSAAARLALAIGGTYYYLTSSVFAEENTYSKHVPSPAVVGSGDGNDGEDDGDGNTTYARLGDIRLTKDSNLLTGSEVGLTTTKVKENVSPDSQAAGDVSVPGATTTAPSELEEEADQQGAFNPETGEINWDCPCLGGMAHGPCGEEFRNAFSCFVYSTAEPKGVDCIEKFKGMQDCFKKYPEHYGAELELEEEGEEDEIAAATAGAGDSTTTTTPSDLQPAAPLTPTTGQSEEEVHAATTEAKKNLDQSIPDSRREKSNIEEEKKEEQDPDSRRKKSNKEDKEREERELPQPTVAK